MNQISQILGEVKKAVVGKDRVLVWVMTVILARGHILLEDIPGVGKTTMALAFAKALGLEYGRVQFTPDVLPSDITGYSIYNKETGAMRYQPGAIVCNIFLADELNRATSRTQSALLEAMEEGQVTVDGVSHRIPQPFIVFATQNPTGASGTQLLPDSQMDRFTVRMSIGYPEPEDERNMVLRRQGGNPLALIRPVVTREQLAAMQDEAADSDSSGDSTAPDGSGDAQAVTLETFGPARQDAAAAVVKAYDASVIRQPSCGQVDLNYFADAAFLGDSLTVGFSDYQINLGGALVCGYTGVGPDAIVNRTAVKSSVRGEEIALDVLAAAQPKKQYILLGTNTLTTLGASDRFLAYYGQMLDMLREALGPDCVIYVESVPPVRPKAAAEKPGLASDVLRGVNEQLAQLAASKGCVYLDLWEALADGEGNLKEMLAAPDGVHLSAGNGYGTWLTYLRNHAKYSANNSWTMGSVYSAQ